MNDQTGPRPGVVANRTGLCGRQRRRDLLARGTIIRSPSARGVVEEAPGAYKDTDAVVEAAHAASLARKVTRLEPVICIKG